MKAYVDANYNSRDCDYYNLNRDIPSKNVWLKNSIDWRVSPKGHVGYLNWKNFKQCYPITTSKSSRSHLPIKSFSTVHPLVQVYADFEAITDDQGKQTPILVCFETDESDETVICEGPHCMDLLFLNSMYSPRIKMVKTVKSFSSSLISRGTMACSFYNTATTINSKWKTKSLWVPRSLSNLQRLLVFSTVSSLQFPGHLWHHGTV